MDSSAEELSCEQHGQQTILFCTYCESILCLECVNDHAGHGMITVQAAREEKKKLIAEQHSRMQELIGELQTAQERGDHLRGLAEAKHGEKTGCIEDAFKKGQADLRKWQQDELDKANKPHNETTRNLTDSSEKLRYAMEEGEGLSTAFDTLLGAPPAAFLRDFKHLGSKMEKQIRTANDRIAEHTAQCTRIESDLERDVVYPRVLKVEEVVPDRGDESRERQLDDQSEQTSPKEVIGTTEPTLPLPGKALCDPHTNRITMFCGTCDVTLCQVCFDEKHGKHTINTLVQAFEEKKASLQNGLESWALAKDRLQEARDNLYSLKETIEKDLGQRIDSINEEYRKQQEEEERCRQKKIATVEMLRCRCTEKIDASAPPVDCTLEEMEDLDSNYGELLRRSKEWLLKESKKLAQRITEQTSSAKEMKEGADEVMTEIQTFLEEESATSAVNLTDNISESQLESPQDNAGTNTQTKSVDLVGPQDTQTATQTSTPIINKEEEILTPQLKFTEASKPDAVIIEEEGLMVTDRPGKSAMVISVRTDGLLSHSQYWEVAVSWRVSSTPPPPEGSSTGWIVCSAGVRQEGSDFSSRLGDDPTSYGVEIAHLHKTNSYCFDCKHQGKLTVSSKKQVLTDDSANNHLGLLLQTPERTLTVIDLGTETQLHTFRELDVSRPFVPVVRFGSVFYHRSFRLIPADSSTSIKRVLDFVNS